MGNNGSIILIPILIFLLRWQLVSGAGPAGNTYSGDPDGKYGSGNPYSGYPNGQGFGLSGKLQATYCGQNQTLPCAEVNALQAVINGFRLLPTIYISSTYCGYRLTTINCTCYRDDKNFILCHITEIYMSSKDLSGYIDPAISGLQFLKILELSNNQLTGSIPASLGNLTNLERLYIINNQLVGSIPESFKNLKSLKILDLSSNYLDGPIPSLRDLQNLNTIGLRFNFLNGPIPASLGNLSSLQILNLYSNILSGPIPDDLGNLTQLQFLALDDNELNGKLPEAFGKLSNITALWLESNYFSGNIPQNYSYLTGLQIFSVAGNDLSGKIPDYIAKWKNLTALILLGNNFDGNLPEGIFKLEKLQTLWVSGLTNPGFAFPKQEKLTTNLYSLILRNCSINGTIPSYIAQWLSLTNLDLSFNNLIGEIPKFSPYLKKIFLTRNKLNGTLPPWIINEHNAPERTNDVALMDLSNNDFANVPSVNHENGTLSDSPNSIIEPRSEYISQKIKECKVKYRSLSINSGGEAVKFGKQNYENDTALSNFYLSPQGNWAYSFSGDYISPTINASGYIKNLTCGVSLPEAQLYVNARVAPVSLTYYAFCLHQGKYNVELHFAETLYSKKEDHSKVGKRVFDVHIQGKRVLQDFNIKKEAGDANKNVMTRFPATVAKNKPLSIEFFWTGRGSLYNPPGQNGPLISAISITRAPRKLSLWEIVVIVAACVLGLLILLAFMWRMGWIGERELRKARIELETQDGKKSFTVKEIIDATGNFSPRKKIGKDGRFGIIYKAELSNLTVAVKKLFPQSKAVAQIGTEVYAKTFKLVHDNLVQLLATYSRKDLHLLIYEYMDHGSLEQALFDPKSSMQLSWKTRYSICLQIAQGLEYLHAKNPPIIHRDIKASNILLDGSSKAKISDFGLAKLYEEDNPFMFIEEGGTRMYMAPEYATHKAVTAGVDVFSFGVLLLEIVSGIKNDENLSKHHDQTIFLLEKVANLHAMVKDAKLQYKKVKYAELVDEKLLNSNYSEEEVVTIIDLAMLCTDQMASLRPIISDVVSVLEGKEIVENVSKIKVKESSTV